VLEGLKIYEELVERSEAKRILSWVNETRDKGRCGELQGIVYRLLVSKVHLTVTKVVIKHQLL
jgi:hypothetical protein